MNLCDMCGKPVASVTSLGGALVCRLCDVDLRNEMDKLLKEGKHVHGLKIARQIYRTTYSNGNFVIKDIPKELMVKVRRDADNAGGSVRDFIVRCIYACVFGADNQGTLGDGKNN